jgi:hypothetical protein
MRLELNVSLPIAEKAMEYVGQIVERNHLSDAIKLANSYIARKSELRRVDVKGR